MLLEAVKPELGYFGFVGQFMLQKQRRTKIGNGGRTLEERVRDIETREYKMRFFSACSTRTCYTIILPFCTTIILA